MLYAPILTLAAGLPSGVSGRARSPCLVRVACRRRTAGVLRFTTLMFRSVVPAHVARVIDVQADEQRGIGELLGGYRESVDPLGGRPLANLRQGYSIVRRPVDDGKSNVNLGHARLACPSPCRALDPQRPYLASTALPPGGCATINVESVASGSRTPASRRKSEANTIRTTPAVFAPEIPWPAAALCERFSRLNEHRNPLLFHDTQTRLHRVEGGALHQNTVAIFG